jgi:phage N-6-adenine-methyltransferase
MTSSALKALTASTGNRTDCWNTPSSVVSDVIAFFDGSLDLDPCSNDIENPNVPAKKVYTESMNGLSHDWIADSVFMNHPYSNSKEWVPYAVKKYEGGNSKEMILLIKLDVSTKWWNSVSSYPWIAVNRRLKFGSGKGAAPFQSAIIYLGNRIERFNTIFGGYGTLYTRHT